MNPAIRRYVAERDLNIALLKRDHENSQTHNEFTKQLVESNYVKNFTWMGIPILQYPSDMMVMQELIWQIKPRYIIETGIAFGGSTLFYATILDAIGRGRVIGMDIDPREENMIVLEGNPLARRITIFKGSSVKPDGWLNALKRINRGPVLVVLDSNHTHDHVLKELRLYAPLVSMDSYIVVFDTAIEQFGYLDSNQDRPWAPGNNPWTAVKEFMKYNDEFVIDKNVERRALITAAPDGFLRRVKPCK